jgi:hypothetical protein
MDPYYHDLGVVDVACLHTWPAASCSQCYCKERGVKYHQRMNKNVDMIRTDQYHLPPHDMVEMMLVGRARAMPYHFLCV